MSGKIMRTEEELAVIDEVLGEHQPNNASREAFVKAVQLKRLREHLVSLMNSLNKFFEVQGLRYFVFGSTLQGVVSYGDFLPNAKSIDLGMLRSDYQAFAALCRSGVADDLPWELCETYEGKYRHVRRLRPLVREKETTRVIWDDDYLYGGNSMPLEIRAEIEIHIFDEVPDDFYMRKKFFRQMKRRNDCAKASLSAREYMTGGPLKEIDPDGELLHFKGMNGIRAIGWRLVPTRLAAWSCWNKAGKYQGTGASQVTSLMFARSKTCPVSDLGDMPYRDFAGIKVRTPQRPDLWAREPIMETTPELARLQNDAKAIVQEIDRICGILGIEYFACGGTMLGYVRSGGFIPWDDDIDVGMFRADYERFKAEAGAVIDSEHFFLQTRETDPNIPYLFSKVRMNGTEYLTDYNVDRDFHKGICVDIFPFDYIPNDSEEQRELRKRVREAEKRHNRIVNRQYPEPQDTHPQKNLDWAIAQMNGRLLAKHYWSFSLDDTQAAYDEVATTYDKNPNAENEYEFVASFVPTYTMARVSDLKPFQRVKFDDIEIMMPAHPEIFLSMQYGDYQQMPYPHQRAGHDLLLWSDEDGVGGGRFADEVGAEK